MLVSITGTVQSIEMQNIGFYKHLLNHNAKQCISVFEIERKGTKDVVEREMTRPFYDQWNDQGQDFR